MSTNRSIFKSVSNLVLGLALTWGGAVNAAAANPAPAAKDESSAVAPYPDKSELLPGKGPRQTWAAFPKLWMERRTEFRRDRQQDRGAVVFLGDSITQGWNSLARTFPDFKTANRGIGGDTTRGVLYRLNEDVIELKPKAVVLLIGTNDVGLGATAEEVVDNIKAIIAALEKSNPRLPVVFCKIMPSSGAQQHRPAETIEKINALVSAAVKGDAQVTVCDTWSIYAGDNGDCRPSEFPDRLHPNAIGYAKWAQALKPIFAKLNLASKVEK